jgi:hypothetical protein
MPNLNALLRKLIDGQVEFVLAGGFAANVHGASFLTRDVDVCLRFSPENLERLRKALEDLHPVHRITPQKLPLNLTPELIASLKNLYLETDLGALDCLGEVLGLGDFDAVKNQSVEIEMEGGKFLVLDIPALIRAKNAMGRPHDKLTVLQLRAILERQSKK